MYFYTTAPISLDLEDTLEIEPRIGAMLEEHRGRVRLVDVEKSNVGAQKSQYNLNFHVMLTPDEFVRVIHLENVVLLNPVNHVRIYTDAPAAYDYCNTTIEVDACVALSRRKNKPIRLVLIKRDQENTQCDRYGSGLHMSLRQEAFEQELADTQYGLAIGGSE